MKKGSQLNANLEQNSELPRLSFGEEIKIMFVSDVMLVGVNAKSPYFKDRVQICTALPTSMHYNGHTINFGDFVATHFFYSLVSYSCLRIRLLQQDTIRSHDSLSFFWGGGSRNPKVNKWPNALSLLDFQMPMRLWGRGRDLWSSSWLIQTPISSQELKPDALT